MIIKVRVRLMAENADKANVLLSFFAGKKTCYRLFRLNNFICHKSFLWVPKADDQKSLCACHSWTALRLTGCTAQHIALYW